MQFNTIQRYKKDKEKVTDKYLKIRNKYNLGLIEDVHIVKF